ncbi:hypothetical protein AB0K16_16740 [Nonomuraea jabiensis]|uniref:hypothetical protein n=1 Tax=Nonomuraea jabiensis TaxID=882448 RepID=UPI0034402368
MRAPQGVLTAAGDHGRAATFTAGAGWGSAPVEIGPIPAESREHFTLLDDYQQPVGAARTSP